MTAGRSMPPIHIRPPARPEPALAALPLAALEGRFAHEQARRQDQQRRENRNEVTSELDLRPADRRHEAENKDEQQAVRRRAAEAQHQARPAMTASRQRQAQAIGKRASEMKQPGRAAY